MSNFDIERFLNEPIYAIDLQSMIGDLADFINFAESNIEWQYRRELQSIRRRAETEEFPPGYQEHLETNAEQRFKVSLPLRVRYGALIGLVTSVEWSIKFLAERLKEPLNENKSRQNCTVFRLSEIQKRTQTGSFELVKDYESLVRIRNCIVHSAGLEKNYKNRHELATDINRIKGFTIDNWHFFGKHVCIERGALDHYVETIGEFVVELHKAVYEQGLVNDDSVLSGNPGAGS